jgi:hypothetical protein
MAQTQITALACEDDSGVKLIQLSCFEKFIDIQGIDKALQMLGICPSPESCDKLKNDKKNKKLGKPEVYGDAKGYAPDSTICLSAKHSGNMKETGAGYLISIVRANEGQRFAGSYSNGVNSKTTKYTVPVTKYQI